MVEIYLSPLFLKKLDKNLSCSEVKSILKLVSSLKDDYHKGDVLTVIGSIVLKELKYKKFRFYFIHSQKLLKFITAEDLEIELIKFIEVSGKGKEQQKIINRIKKEIKVFGFDFF